MLGWLCLIFAHDFTPPSSCISGRQGSSRPAGASDRWSYKYRCTDVIISVCGPPCAALVEELTDMCHTLLRGNKYITNYLNDSFAALRMVQRTVNNVIVVRMYYTIITHISAIQSLYSVSYLVGVVFRQYYGVNCIHCCLNFQHSYYFTYYLRSSHCRNMENVLFTQASHSSMQNLRCMYKIIYACMIMIIYELSPRHQGCRRTPPCCPGQP